MGDYEEHYKIAWVSWDAVCKRKEEDGLGIRDLELFNKVLLGKWRWRLLKGKDCLWGKVLVARYGDIGRYGEEETFRKGSLWWRDLGNISPSQNEKNWFYNNLNIKLGRGWS